MPDVQPKPPEQAHMAQAVFASQQIEELSLVQTSARFAHAGHHQGDAHIHHRHAGRQCASGLMVFLALAEKPDSGRFPDLYNDSGTPHVDRKLSVLGIIERKLGRRHKPENEAWTPTF